MKLRFKIQMRKNCAHSFQKRWEFTGSIPLVRKISKDVMEISDYAFYDCTNMNRLLF